MRFNLVNIIITLLLPTFLLAPTPSTSLGAGDLSSLISPLHAQIQALQTRINELEAELGVQASASEAGIDGQTLPERHVGASIPLPSFIQTLSLGSRGDDVRNLQTFLSQFKDIYPEGLITGYFGPLTEKAVQRWQTKHNIVVSGTSETTGYGRIVLRQERG